MTDFHSRHRSLFDPSTLEAKRVLLVGAGSVGSFLAEMLVRSGVEHVTVFDPDVVSETNLCRTVYEAADVSVPKVEALAGHLRAIRADIEVDARGVSLTDVDDDALSAEIERVDLVIAVTDHPPTQARLGALSYHRRPAVFAGVYAEGAGGEVLWTRPDETPCYACVLGSIRGANVPSRGHTDYGIATGQLAAEPALGVDILAVTVRAAKIALSLLLAPHDARFREFVDPSRSVLFVGNRTDWIWREPFETVWARADRLPDCVCRLTPGASTADLDLDTGDDLP